MCVCEEEKGEQEAVDVFPGPVHGDRLGKLVKLFVSTLHRLYPVWYSSSY